MAEESLRPVGTVAEEAARLLDALGGWAASAAGAPGEGTPGTGSHESEGPATEGATPGHCAHCGAEDGAGRAVVCQLCPVCQGINLLRSVRPETVDRLADLAGVVAGTLRDLADQRRAATGGTPPPQPRTGSRVQDIPVEGEDEERDVRDEGSGRASR